jgi:hypothetical protein
MDLIAWPNTMPRDDPMTTPSWLPDPLRQPPCGFMDNSASYPQPHRAIIIRSVSLR